MARSRVYVDHADFGSEVDAIAATLRTLDCAIGGLETTNETYQEALQVVVHELVERVEGLMAMCSSEQEAAE